MAREHEAEPGHEHEQEWKQREEAVVGDRRGQLATFVVRILALDGNENAGSRVALLERIDIVKKLHKLPSAR